MALNLEQAQVANAWHEKVREGKKEEEKLPQREIVMFPLLFQF